MEVTTNNHWRQILYWHDLTQKEQKELQDSYDSVKESNFFRYKGQIYDLSDFVRINMPGWDASKPDSFFSGISVKVSECGDAIKVGQYCC